MPDITSDGNTRVAFAASITNLAAPTVAELNAAILLQTVVTSDGLAGWQPTTNTVDNSSLASTFDTKSLGTDAYGESMLRLKKQTGTDTAYNTLTRGTIGYIVIRRDVAQGTAWAASQSVEVYPIVCGQTRRMDPVRNTVSRYEVPTIITDPPELRATVAA